MDNGRRVVIQATGLRKEYRRGRGEPVVALDGLDLEVPAGSVFGFLGPNGSGKTTTIRCLLGLVAPTAGTCRPLGAVPRTDYARVQRRVGSLTEGQTLFPAFSGRRNLALLGRLYGIGAKTIDAALDRVQLSERADEPVRTYSLGMRQRLGIAAALLKDPELLVLDEPANGLDPAGIRQVRSLLRSLGDEGRTVFVSSHVLAEVEQLCDRVAILSRGRTVAAGSVAEVLGAVQRHGVVVRSDDVDGGVAALQAAGMETVVENGAIRVAIASTEAPRVAEILARSGLYPRELRPAAGGLEAAFLALTETQDTEP